MDWSMSSSSALSSSATTCTADSKSKTTIDEILARELNELSLNDRIAIQEEIHCVKSNYIEETPQLIESSLLLLPDQIQAIPSADRAAYVDALITDNTYIQSKDFCLMFLRASLFDVKKAALGITRYTQLVFKLFGPAALNKPLQFSDLNGDEQDEMKKGCYQILPTRDRAGRLVVFYRTIKREGFTNRNRVSHTVWCPCSWYPFFNAFYSFQNFRLE
jgi:hypothetical protein